MAASTDQNLHMITSSDLDGLAVTVTPTADVELPAANMLDPRRGLSMRVSGTPTAIEIKFTREISDSGFYASGFAMARHNFPVGSTARIRLWDGINQTGVLVYDSGAIETAVVIPWGAFLAGIDPWSDAYELGIPGIFSHWFDAVGYKSLQIDIDFTPVTSPALPFIDIGRLYIGWAFVPTINMARGASITWVDKSIHNRTAGGGLRTENIDAYRKFDLDLNWMPVSDRERLSHLLERVGKGGDMLISLDPTATGRTSLENTMVGKRTVDNKISQIGPSTHATKMTFEES
jgi:hypothetical protein